MLIKQGINLDIFVNNSIHYNIQGNIIVEFNIF